jgi:hypothetical protein
MSSSTAAGAGILSASVGKALAVAAGLALTAAVVLYMGGALGWNGAAEDAANHAEASNPLSGPGARGVERPSGPRDSGSDVTLAALEEESTSQVAAEQRAADEPAANEPAGGEPAPTLEDTLNATMGSLAWEHVHLRTPLKQVEDQFGIRIQIDRRVVGVPVYDFTEIEPATVPYATSGMLAEVNLHELPLSTAVDLIASELGLQAVWEPGYVWMSTRDRILREVPRHPAERFEAYANKDFRNTEISAEFIDVHVRTVVEWLNNAVKGANIVVDYRVVAPPGKDRHTIPPRGKATDGVVEYVHLRDIRLDETLRLLCRTLNLTPVVQSGYLWLSTPELIRSDGLADAPPNLRTRMDKTLQQPVSIVFQDLDLHDSFGFVRAAYNINIVVDQRAIAWKPEPASARPLRGAPESAGMSHGMIYCISIENVTLRTYLDVLTRQLGLAFAVQDDAIVVSSRERLDAGPIPEADLLRPEDYPTIDAPVAPPALKPAPRRTGAELPQRAVLRSIQRSPDGDYRVEMDLAGTGRSWFYKEGDAFGEFKLEKIDAEAGCITLLNEKTGETFRICLDDPAP